MAKVKLILDKRRANRDNMYPIRLYVYHRSQIYISTGLCAALHEWNAEAGLFAGGDPTVRAKNARLRDVLNKCEMMLLNLSVNGELEKMTAKMLTHHIQQGLNVVTRGRALLVEYLEKAKNGKAERTKRLFTWTQQRVEAFDAKVCVADIDEAWVTRFRDAMLADGYAPNTVAQGLSWVSRALSLAIADGLITRNPCSGVRKPKAETRKKYLPLEKLRELRDMTFERFRGFKKGSLEFARDFFMLQFYLIGINVVDLVDLAEIADARVDYVRHKTDSLYSVKVQPEAMAIIEKWRGEKALIQHHYASAATLCSVLNNRLKHLVPGLSTNWARHTWASMAAELEIPIETISHALGHKIGSPVTAIYVAYNQKKVDDANRRVIDYLNADLKGKK